MFSSKALPLPTPSTFATEPHPLRPSAGSNVSSSSSTSDAPRLLPHGPCKFILLHPTQQNQQCSCQSYHHNRIALGSICDCGHQACYHVHTLPAQDQARPLHSPSQATEQGLLERMTRLEEALRRERQSREADVSRLKELWETDIRMLREALAPFYKTELDMRRKLIELEDRVDGNYDEQVRLKDRLVALDDTNMMIEKRIQELEARPKRRRTRQPNGEEEYQANGNGVNNGTRTISSHIDERSVQSSSSRALSPQSSFAPVQEPEEPRSSGILNLVDPLRPRVYAPAPLPLPPILRRPVVYEREEPRSSGFLALDLAEREGTDNKKVRVSVGRAASQPHTEGSASDKQSPPQYSQSNPDALIDRRSPSFPLPPPPPPPPPPSYTSVARKDNIHHVLAGQLSPRKRKHMAEHLALDVLADVSMASPLIP